MNTQWIVVCDASRARILSRVLPKGQLQHVCEIENPKGRERASEMVSDEPGRLFKKGRGGFGNSVSVAEPQTSPHEVELRRHAHHLSKVLQEGLDHGKYDSLGIIAPPHLLGELRSLLGPQVHKRLEFSIAKDLVDAKETELAHKLVEFEL